MLEKWGEQIDTELSKPVHKRQQIRLTLLFTFLMSALQAIFCNYGYSPPYYLLTDTASQPGRLNLRLLMAGVEALNMVIADQDSEPDLNKQ